MELIEHENGWFMTYPDHFPMVLGDPFFWGEKNLDGAQECQVPGDSAVLWVVRFSCFIQIPSGYLT
jgi:hypothetical protein